MKGFRNKLYYVLQSIGMRWLFSPYWYGFIARYEQSKRDRAMRARFKAFLTEHGFRKVNGKWKQDTQ